MAKTLSPDLLTAQQAGYPTGSYAPALRCILTSGNPPAGNEATYDYSFDPTVTTNTLLSVQQIEERESDSGIILLWNGDRSLPDDLTGYYVDIGWGHNTASGLLYNAANGAVSPRLWVTHHTDVSGAVKGSRPQIVTILVLQGVWSAVLNKENVRLGESPYFRLALEGDSIAELENKTIYDVLKHLIKTALPAQTGYAFTLDDLGDEDDGHINIDVPFPSGGEFMRTINADAPGRFQTYGEVINGLLELTGCAIIPRAGLAFKIIYPEKGDAYDKIYYSRVADGHPFYEAEHRRLNGLTNHVEVYGYDPDTDNIIVGDWFDSDHYATAPIRPFTPADIQTAYTGTYMPVTESTYEEGLDSVLKCIARAAFYAWQIKDSVLGSRILIPMDASVELCDNVATHDYRGT